MKKFFKIVCLMTIIAPLTMDGQSSNPLLQEWNTPYQTPPFKSIKNEHYVPATRTAIAEAEANIQKIIDNKEKPTFENTIVALETASAKLDRITGLLYNIVECNADEELQEILMELSPEITRYGNNVMMNEKLFARVKKVYEQRDKLKLTTEQATLLEETYQGFVRNGVNLNKADKKRYAEISEELSKLSLQFNKNCLADNNSFFLHVTQKEELSGLPESAIAAAHEEAMNRKMEGWVFTLDYPSYGPFMSYADNRDLRQKMWTAYNSQCNHGDTNDNNEIIRKITLLRFQQAQLLGYKNYCQYRLSDLMMETPEKLAKFMQEVMQAAYPVAVTDVKEVEHFAFEMDAKKLSDGIQRWDIGYYSEKLKQKKYDFDAELLRPYFQLEKVREGIFNLYGKLYGITFKENPNIEVYHPDVKVYEVFDGKRFMGILYMDMFPRSSKSSGAWMTEFREQSNIGGKQVRPLIQLVCNFTKPTSNKPSLLTFDEVETFMHEFGHAMHGMLTECTYTSLSGTSVKRDFVELFSQLMENWCYEPEFLNTFAHHYQTGATIPTEYIQRIKASENFLSGYYCVRQLSLGMTDMGFHSQEGPLTENIEDFEHKHMVEMLPVVKGCLTSTSFGHIFAGGYASGYYGYKWAEVLDADVFSKFKQEGIFNSKTASEFRTKMLSKGGTEHPSKLFKDFLGRDPNPRAFFVRSGFLMERTPNIKGFNK